MLESVLSEVVLFGLRIKRTESSYLIASTLSILSAALTPEYHGAPTQC